MVIGTIYLWVAVRSEPAIIAVSGSHFVWCGGSISYSWLGKHDFRVIRIVLEFVA